MESLEDVPTVTFQKDPSNEDISDDSLSGLLQRRDFAFLKHQHPTAASVPLLRAPPLQPTGGSCCLCAGLRTLALRQPVLLQCSGRDVAGLLREDALRPGWRHSAVLRCITETAWVLAAKCSRQRALC